MADRDKIKLTFGDEIIRITSEGFYYRGQLIEDAGECHRLMVDFLRRTKPESDQLRDLLIALSSHMAYMQGQLQAHHEYDDLEDFYWYRESVILRQRAAEAIGELNK